MLKNKTMFFTQEDYRKIEKWLLANSMKDTDFVGASTPLKGNETVVLVQDGKNVKTSVKDIVDQFFLLGVSDFLNITDKYGESYITIDQAIQLIPFRSRKEGQVITFLNTDGNWEIYQFIGKLNQWNNPTLWNNPLDWEKFIIDSILPDEEDLTKSLPDENGNSYLSLKDREYNPEDFSGLGRVYLRKNMQKVVNPNTGMPYTTNLLTQAMISKENTIYIIQYDYSLNYQTITIPDNCVLVFNGGSIDNGTLNCNSTIIVGKFIGNSSLTGTYTYQDAQADEEDITQNQSSVLKFKDKEYDEANFSGLGRTYLRKNIVNGVNILSQDMINNSNTIYHIQYDYNLNGGTLTVPEGCTLDFQGGSFSNGVIIGNNTKTFNANFINCPVSGTWSEHINNYISRLDFPYYTNVTYIKGRYLNEDTGNKTTYWLTTIPHKDENGNLIKLKVGLANDNKNGELNTAESTVLFAQRHRATYCSNSFLFNTSTNIPVGSLVVNGEILLDNGFPESPTRKCKALGIKADNTLISINAEETGYAQKALDNGCTDMIQGWYPFVLDGELYLEGRTEDDYHPRSAIGQKADKSLVFLQCNGRTKDNEGLNLRAMGNILIQEGCVFAYNLDGGGSTSGVYRGIKLNDNIDSLQFDREVSGFLYITKETDYSYDNQLVDAYAEIQKSRDIANSDLVEFRRATRILDANKTFMNGWYSIGGSLNSGAINLPTYTNGQKVLISALIHLVDNDNSMNNSMQLCVDKQLNQLYTRSFSSNGYPDPWVCVSSPFKNTLPIKGITGSAIYKTPQNIPMWYDGETWRNALGLTRADTFADFYKQLTLLSNINEKEDLGCGIFRISSSEDTPTNIPIKFLINLRFEDSNPIGNKVQLLLSKECAQIYYREIESSGYKSEWSVLGSPAYSTSYRPTKGLIQGYQIFDTTLSKPIWWNGKEWITAMGTTNYSKLGDFHAQPTYKAEYGSAANLPAGVYRVPDGGDGPAGDLLQQYLINFRWEKEDSTNKSARQFMISKVSGGIYTRQIEASGNVLDWTVANCDAASKNSRPTRGKIVGLSYFDTTVGSPIWWDGSKWVNANGYNADIKTYGTFSQKPLSSDDIKIGFEYFCTDKQTTEGATNGIMIYHKGNDIWVDALGRVVV